MAEQINKAFGGLNLGGTNFKPIEIFERLGISCEQFAYLLDRDFFAPVLAMKPNGNTVSYIDPVMGECGFRIGQPVVYNEDGERKMAFLIGLENGNAIWKEMDATGESIYISTVEDDEDIASALKMEIDN